MVAGCVVDNDRSMNGPPGFFSWLRQLSNSKMARFKTENSVKNAELSQFWGSRLLMEEILHQFVDVASHYLRVLYRCRTSSINSMKCSGRNRCCVEWRLQWQQILFLKGGFVQKEFFWSRFNERTWTLKNDSCCSSAKIKQTEIEKRT